jgi:hypothetical protein
MRWRRRITRRLLALSSTALVTIGLAGVVATQAGTATAAGTTTAPAAAAVAVPGHLHVRYVNQAACPELIVYGTRGTNENDAANLKTTAWIGPTLWPVYSELSKVFGTGVIGLAGNGYPAVNLDWALDSGGANYANAVNSGVKYAVADLTYLHTICPHAGIAALGYSQGADVVRRAVAQLWAALTPAQQARGDLSWVTAVLLGDPNFDPLEQTGFSSGDFDASSKGLAPWSWASARLLLSQPPQLPMPLLNEYCHKGDLVCQGLALGNGIAPHLTYGSRDAKGLAWRLGHGILGPNKLTKLLAQGYVNPYAQCDPAGGAPFAIAGYKQDRPLAQYATTTPVVFKTHKNTTRVDTQSFAYFYTSVVVKVRLSTKPATITVRGNDQILDQRVVDPAHCIGGPTG